MINCNYGKNTASLNPPFTPPPPLSGSQGNLTIRELQVLLCTRLKTGKGSFSLLKKVSFNISAMFMVLGIYIKFAYFT